MREYLDKSFFPYVIKPARYSGGEPGQIVKDHTGRISCLLAVTDRYERAAHHPLTQSHYHFLNSHGSIVCERMFAFDRDAELLLRSKNIPPFSIESCRPAREFACIAFLGMESLQFPLIPAFLELAGLPVIADSRDDSHPIVVVCGTSCANPEPILDFVDCALVGDSEEPLARLLERLRESTSIDRKQKLQVIADSNPSARLSVGFEGRKTVQYAPSVIPPNVFPDTPVVPLIETLPNRLDIELGRHGLSYLPTHYRAFPGNELASRAEAQLQASGYSETGILPSPSVFHEEFPKNVSALAGKCDAFGSEMSLPYLHPLQVTASLLDSVQKVCKTSLKIFAGAASDRLRAFLGLDFNERALISAVSMSFSKGYGKVRLSCVMGIPGEEVDDLQLLTKCIDTIVQKSREIAGRKTVSVNLYPFQPRPHTPYQWDGAVTSSELVAKTATLKKMCRHEGLTISLIGAETHEITTALLRGDRSYSQFLAKAATEGFRFNDQQEPFDKEKWLSWANECGIDISKANRAKPFSATLPWDSIIGEIPTERLAQMRQETSKEVVMAAESKVIEPTAFQPSAPAVEFGRTKKKVVSRVSSAPTKNQIRIRWGRTDRLRYLAHLDCIRIFERTIRRSQLPIAWSGIERPTMKISFGPPLPLGFTSECEFVDITLNVNLTTSMIEKFRLALPPGLVVYETRVIFGKPQSLSAALNRAVYTIPVEMLPVARTETEDTVQKFLGQSSCEVIRETKSGSTTTDIRSAVHELTFRDELLLMTLGIGEGGYARPSELLTWLLPGHRDIIPALMCHRLEMYRLESDGRRIAGIEV